MGYAFITYYLVSRFRSINVYTFWRYSDMFKWRYVIVKLHKSTKVLSWYVHMNQHCRNPSAICITNSKIDVILITESDSTDRARIVLSHCYYKTYLASHRMWHFAVCRYPKKEPVLSLKSPCVDSRYWPHVKIRLCLSNMARVQERRTCLSRIKIASKHDTCSYWPHSFVQFLQCTL